MKYITWIVGMKYITWIMGWVGLTWLFLFSSFDFFIWICLVNKVTSTQLPHNLI